MTIHTLQKDQKNKKKGADEDLNFVRNEKVQYAPVTEGDDTNKNKTTKDADLVVSDVNLESATQIQGDQKSKKKLTKKASLLITKIFFCIYAYILYMIMQQLIMCNLFRIFLLILKKKERRGSLKTMKCWKN